MTTPEGKLKKECDKLLKEFSQVLPMFYFKTHGGKYQTPGLPDYIICIAGFFHGIELKANEGTLTMLQLAVAKQISSAGGRYIVIREAIEIENFLKNIFELMKNFERETHETKLLHALSTHVVEKKH